MVLPRVACSPTPSMLFVTRCLPSRSPLATSRSVSSGLRAFHHGSSVSLSMRQQLVAGTRRSAGGLVPTNKLAISGKTDSIRLLTTQREKVKVLLVLYDGGKHAEEVRRSLSLSIALSTPLLPFSCVPDVLLPLRPTKSGRNQSLERQVKWGFLVPGNLPALGRSMRGSPDLLPNVTTRVWQAAPRHLVGMVGTFFQTVPSRAKKRGPSWRAQTNLRQSRIGGFAGITNKKANARNSYFATIQ